MGGEMSGAESSSGAASDSDSEHVEGGAGRGTPADPEAARLDRKAHKAAVKEANRERRKHKLPKHVKKHALAKHKKK